MAIALDRSIRKILEKAITGKDGAREIVEDGARKALTELGVEDARRPDGLTKDQTDLRNRLRAHARSLGDPMQLDGSIKANRLVREIAYEHWHRALFARFLAENDLLIDPDHKVAVSLSDLEEIAKEEGRDLIELAADWAEPMLPQIFRRDDPVLALALPPETKAGITEIVKSLPHAVFDADDSLGWVYQFWQADQKNQVNESEVKIGADELPVVTQLFTEDYMVLFLLQNTLGAWWAGKMLAANPALAVNAESEDELRDKTSPPGYRWSYLRFMREPRDGETYETATGPWRAAAGTFEAWPTAAKEITVLDPCMGSGHFLVFALPILVAFRCAEEALDERTALKAVLADNLFGLEIDPRCTQIAAFALALASWKRLGGPEPLPRLNLACSGLAIGLAKSEFLELADKIADTEGWKGKTDLLGTDRTPLGERASATHRGELEALYDLFEKAPHLGSLIDPRRTLERAYGPLYATGIEKLGTVLERLLEKSDATAESREIAVTAQGLARAAELLGRTYSLVATNVPYLGRGKMGSVLRNYCDQHFPEGKHDLSTCFVQRCSAFSDAGSSYAVVTPQNWASIGAYKAFRLKLITNQEVSILARLGRAAFQDMYWWAANTMLSIYANRTPGKNSHVSGFDTAAAAEPLYKASTLKSDAFRVFRQETIREVPDYRLIFSGDANAEYLSTYADSFVGTQNGDNPRLLFLFWERPKLDWEPAQQSFDKTAFDGSFSSIFRPGVSAGAFSDLAWRPQASQAAGNFGFVIRHTNHLPASYYLGTAYDQNICSIVPKHSSHAPAIWAYISSDEYRKAIGEIDQSLKVTAATLTKVPFELSYWDAIAAERYPDGLPKPYSNDPTQWLFDGHLRGSADPNVSQHSATSPRLVTPHGIRPGMADHPLQVAVARLLGYRWPRQNGSSFMDCAAVPEPDEVDRSGLVDSDGIVPLPGLAGEADAASRLRELIRAVWGPDYVEGTIRELLVAEEAKATDLGTWLADEFFNDHCKLFLHTPFIWHVWDGVRGGFSALVNYHRLCEGNGAGRRLLEKLRDSYLGEWISAQRRGVAASEAGAEGRLIAAEHLRGELTKVIEGDSPYDIFVRWKTLYRQPIGWEPDIDDGVRLNIRPFLTARPKNSGRRDGCILRVTPRVKKHAGADRGAEPNREKEDFPWFWAEDHDVETENFTGGPQFIGRRYNDFHYTRAFKQRARDAKARTVSDGLSKPALQNQGGAS